MSDRIATRALRDAITNYLIGNNMRPELERAIAGLDACRIGFESRADTLFQLPWGKEDRQQAIRNLQAVIRTLRGYHDRLEQIGFHTGVSEFGSGVQASKLGTLRHYLGVYLKEVPIPFEKKGIFVEDYPIIIRAHNGQDSREPLETYATKIQGLIEDILRAFR